jgi:hypothetical protein
MRIGVEFVEWLGDLDSVCGGVGDFVFVPVNAPEFTGTYRFSAFVFWDKE